MLSNNPFLTEFDPNARVRGSRDPLGFQTIWTAFGRRVVKNLTTVTTSLRGFTTYILGIYFAEKLVDEYNWDEDEISNLFLKFEQLVAYSRIANLESNSEFDDDTIRGVLKVYRNLDENNGVVKISHKQQHQILSNQKTYGLWGLYSVASRNSKILEENTPRLTPPVKEFIESEYIPRLEGKGKSIIGFLKQEKDFAPHKKDSLLSKQLADINKNKISKAEKDFYYKYLLSCDDGKNLQIVLWELIKKVNKKGDIKPSNPFSMEELTEIIKNCKSEPELQLAKYLTDIRQIEQVIGPLDVLFSYLLRNDSRKINSVCDDISEIWKKGISYIDVENFKLSLYYIKEQHPDEIERFLKIATFLKNGDYKEVIELLVEQNKYIMKKRGLNAWVDIKKGIIEVRFLEQSSDLTEYDSLYNLWRNNYFINSLKRIGFEIERDIDNGK